MNQPEPWLRGPVAGVPPLAVPLFHAFQHVREEVAAVTEGLTAEQLWTRPHGLTSLGFHIRHIGGAAERLTAYLREQALTPEQLAAMAAETEPGASRDELLAALDQALARVEEYARTLDAAAFIEPRYVGRKRLPTSVAGLVTHIAEHSLRHVGQVVTTAQLVRAMQA